MTLFLSPMLCKTDSRRSMYHARGMLSTLLIILMALLWTLSNSTTFLHRGHYNWRHTLSQSQTSSNLEVIPPLLLWDIPVYVAQDHSSPSGHSIALGAHVQMITYHESHFCRMSASQDRIPSVCSCFIPGYSHLHLATFKCILFSCTQLNKWSRSFWISDLSTSLFTTLPAVVSSAIGVWLCVFFQVTDQC